MKTTKLEAYQKCINVIESCNTFEQLDGAYKYSNLMYDMYNDYELISELYHIYLKKHKFIKENKKGDILPPPHSPIPPKSIRTIEL